MKVSVRYVGQLRQAAGVASEAVEPDPPCTVADLLRRLADRHGEIFRDFVLDAGGEVRRPLLLFVGDEQVRPEETALRDGDVVTVLTPMAGG